MRQQLGITLDGDEIWGRDSSPSDRVILPNIENAYSDAYNSSKLPDRRHINYTYAQLTAIGYDVNRFGAMLPWDTAIIYEQNAFIVGSDGKIYRSEVAANIGYDPINPANVPSKWRELSDIYGIPNLKTDSKYVKFTYHPNGLTKTGAGVWAYDISLFEGAGLVHDDIRELYISAWAFSGDNHVGQVLATLPSGDQEIRICGAYGVNGDDDCGSYSSGSVPINKGQATFNIRAVNIVRAHSFDFVIHGARVICKPSDA